MLFNGYFGVNGEKLHTVKQIKQQFGVSDSAHKAKSIATKLVESGEYTQDEIEEIINSRREKSKQNYLELYSNWYNSYYGLNGYSRKSVSMLAYEFDYSISGIMAGIKRYKNYLQSLSEKEQEENQPI